MIDDHADVGLADRPGQFGRIVGVEDRDRRAGGKRLDHARCLHAPSLQHEGGLAARRAQQHRLGRLAAHLGQVPRPDERRPGRVGIGGLVAEDECCCHCPCPLVMFMESGAL